MKRYFAVLTLQTSYNDRGINTVKCTTCKSTLTAVDEEAVYAKLMTEFCAHLGVEEENAAVIFFNCWPKG